MAIDLSPEQVSRLSLRSGRLEFQRDSFVFLQGVNFYVCKYDM